MTPPAPFQLLETMRLERGVVARLERHLSRIRQSANHFGYTWDESHVRDMLAAAAADNIAGCWRVRLLVGPDGVPEVTCTPHDEAPATRWRVGLAPEPADTGSPFIRHKTTCRDTYETARRARPDLDDVLLWNTNGEITESTIANVVIASGGRRITPHITCGLLPGVLRAELLERGEIAEGLVTRNDLTQASRVWLINSLRGWVPAVLVPA